MNHQQDNLPELIDCCRPQADDLQLPELQPLAAAIQTNPQVDRRLKKSHRIDALIGQSIRDVPVPAGLEERLLASLSSNQPRSESTATAIDLDVADAMNRAEEINPVDSGVAIVGVAPIGWRRVAKYRWKVGLPALGAVAAMLIAMFFFHESVPRFASQEDVAKQSIKWLNDLVESDWANTRFPDKEFPLPPQPILQHYRWQRVASRSSSLNVTCYNIAPAQPATHLFVCLGVRSSKLPATPPPLPCQLKPGWLVGGWQTNGVVYVLAVQGNAQRYDSLLRRSQKVASTSRLQVRS